VWFYHRLTGWTTNANQLGLLCLILVLLSLHLAHTTPSRGARLLALACAALPTVAGYLTRSDSFVLALAVSLLCYGGVMYWRALRGVPRPSTLATLGVYTLPVAVAAASPLAYILAVAWFDQRPPAPGEDALERDIGYRTELWWQAIERSIASGMLGLGPGPHLVRPASLREPDLDALPNFEAHNTLIDMLLQGGLLAVASIVWLMWSAARRTLAAGLGFLFMLMIGLGVFAQTHFIVRHPMTWFAIAFALAASDRSAVQNAPQPAWRRRPRL
jgi:hypothetical protein